MNGNRASVGGNTADTAGANTESGNTTAHVTDPNAELPRLLAKENNDRYYTVGWSDSHRKIITLRIDRIAAPKLTDIPAEPRPEGFDMAFYAESVIMMYDGSVCDVTLYCKNEIMKHVIDRFGENIKTKIMDEEHFAAYVRVPASPTFFAWVFTFGGGIKITAPEDVAESYREMLKAALC